jgi:hypothetical protein
MDVTPTPKMLEVMNKMTDGLIGEEPGKLEKSHGATNRRHARRACMDLLHNLVRLSMREGVRRYLEAQGMATTPDSIKPDPVAKAVRNSFPESDTIQNPH